MKELKELLLEKERLENDENISDDMYYMLIERIDNQIANDYTVEEIKKAEKEIEEENK